MLIAATVVGAVVIAGWSGIVGLLWWQQDKLIFPGWGFGLVQDSGIEPGDERLELTTPDGVRLVGALRPARGPSRGLLLSFGGNAEDADWRLRHFEGWLEDVDIATFFYRGYGPSGGAPTQANLVADAQLIHDRLVERLRPRQVVAVGYSLGSGVAAQLGRIRPLAGLILVTPFDSIAGLAADRYPFVPVRLLLRHPFRTDLVLADHDLPVAVIAAEADRVVPMDSTKRLIKAPARPVLVAWIPGADHVSLYQREEYRRAMREALDRLLVPQASDTLRRASGL